jgi:hypothetical protein
MIHTYATLEVSKSVMREIFDKLDAAGYEDQLEAKDGQPSLIDMHGIALVPEP